MLKQFCLCILLFFGSPFWGQINLVGYCKKNNVSLKTANFQVFSENSLIASGRTNAKGVIKFELQTGKDYTVKLNEPSSIPMFFEVRAKNASVAGVTTQMKIETDIPFFYKYDEDIDIKAFDKPFAVFYFDGKDRMTSDTALSGLFYRNMFKKPIKLNDSLANVGGSKKLIKIAGVIKSDSKLENGIGNLKVQLFKEGSLISSAVTNRNGVFLMKGIELESGYELKIKNDNNYRKLWLSDEDGLSLNEAAANGSEFVWSLDSNKLSKIWNEYFTYSLGGKLIQSTNTKKEFFSNKTVWLLNKNYTAIKKAKTNVFGAFVFDDIQPGSIYYVSVMNNDCLPMCRIDLLNKDDKFITVLDTTFNGYSSSKLVADNNFKFDNLTLNNSELKMNVKATLYGDNIKNPIGKLKVLLLNDNYLVIDSTVTDDFGTFKFKYLPFLKKFFLSMENKEKELDVFQNIVVYGDDKNLVKVLTVEKSRRFNYKVISSEMQKLREIEMEDPWLEITVKNAKTDKTLIIENILFERNKSSLTPQAMAVLNKVAYTLSQNIKITVQIIAHTDCIGTEESNLKLSNARATEVKKYLIANGVLESNMSSLGLGESKPLNNCGENCTEAEHALNRRVEFILNK
jgi:outer membrane protein OmpA-like peptidoglycan-associated protein